MRDLFVQRHRGAQAIQHLIEHAPSTGGLALWMAHEDMHSDRHGPPVTCDGAKIYYRASFEYLTMRQQMGLVAHEMLHIALRHIQRLEVLRDELRDVDTQLFNICADAVVNSALAHAKWLELPAGSVYLDQLLTTVLGVKEDAETALRSWDVERLYRAIDDRKGTERNSILRRRGANSTPNSQVKAGRVGAACGRGTDTSSCADGARAARTRRLGSGIHQDLITAPGYRTVADDEADYGQAWADRLRHASTADGECSFVRRLMTNGSYSRTPWKQVLRMRLASALAPKLCTSWSRPSRSYLANRPKSRSGRRVPWEPGTSHSTQVPRIALIVDVSGSIADDVLGQFTREIEAIARLQQAALMLIVGDDKVRNTILVERGRGACVDLDLAGGGGTDFSPLLAEAATYRPNIAIVLTDLEGPAGPCPPFPTIWAVPPSHAHPTPPFGQKLVLV